MKEYELKLKYLGGLDPDYVSEYHVHVIYGKLIFSSVQKIYNKILEKEKKDNLSGHDVLSLVIRGFTEKEELIELLSYVKPSWKPGLETIKYKTHWLMD